MESTESSLGGHSSRQGSACLPLTLQASVMIESACTAPFTDGGGAARWAPGRRYEKQELLASDQVQIQARGWEVFTTDRECL